MEFASWTHGIKTLLPLQRDLSVRTVTGDEWYEFNDFFLALVGVPRTT